MKTFPCGCSITAESSCQCPMHFYAPQLLAACQAVLEWYDRDGSVGGICDPMEELRAAIHKATGEQP